MNPMLTLKVWYLLQSMSGTKVSCANNAVCKYIYISSGYFASIGKNIFFVMLGLSKLKTYSACSSTVEMSEPFLKVPS